MIKAIPEKDVLSTEQYPLENNSHITLKKN